MSTHARTCVCMHVPTTAQPHLKGVRVCTTCASVCAATISLIHPLCLSVCLYCTSVCPDACIYNPEVLSMCNKHFMLGQTAVIYTHTYTHSHTFNTVTQAQHSVNSHEKHTHSPKRWQPGKNVGWQGRQLVLGQPKTPVSRRNRGLGRQLSYILRKTHKQTTYIHINKSIHVCMYDCMRSERESASHSSALQLKAVSDLYMCTHACVWWYHFANLSTVSVCPPVHTVTQTHTHTHTHKQH